MEKSSIIDTLNLVAANLAVLVLSVNVLLFSLKFKELNAPFRGLFYFLILNLLTEILAFIFSEYEYNNLPILHCYTLGEFILFSFFYRSLSYKPNFFTRHFWLIIGTGSLLIIANSLFFQPIFGFNSTAKTGVQISLIVYAVIYFYNLVADEQFAQLKSKSLRLVNSAVIIYYSGSLFIFMFSQISFGNEAIFKLFWIFNSFLYVTFHLIIFTALWIAFYRKTPSSR
jgi:hypothetical protein